MIPGVNDSECQERVRAKILARLFFWIRNNRPSLYISIHQCDTV